MIYSIERQVAPADPPIGNRIHVTGNVASGKSTLARWVVAGSYGGFSRRIIWPRLDTVVWLDLPMPVLAWRALRRSWKRWRTGALLWGRDMVERLADRRWAHIRFVRLRSAREVEEFVRRAGSGVGSYGPG